VSLRVMTKVTSSQFFSLQSVNLILLLTSLFIIPRPTRFRKNKKRKATETRGFFNKVQQAKFPIINFTQVQSSSKRKKIRYYYPRTSKNLLRKCKLWKPQSSRSHLKNRSGRNIVRELKKSNSLQCLSALL